MCVRGGGQMCSIGFYFNSKSKLLVIGRSHLLPGEEGGGGSGYFQGGRNLFLVMYRVVGASYISLGFFLWGGGEGVRCVPLVFAFIQSQSFLSGRGGGPPRPSISQMILPRISNIHTSIPKGNDRSPESNVPMSNLISKNI